MVPGIIHIYKSEYVAVADCGNNRGKHLHEDGGVTAFTL